VRSQRAQGLEHVLVITAGEAVRVLGHLDAEGRLGLPRSEDADAADRVMQGVERVAVELVRLGAVRAQRDGGAVSPGSGESSMMFQSRMRSDSSAGSTGSSSRSAVSSTTAFIQER
jgi:hypothetical protein